MLFDYLKRVITKNVVIALFFVDLLGFVFFGRQLPWYAYPLSFILGLLIASYQVYREARLEVVALTGSVPDLEIYFRSDQGPMKKLEVVLFSPEHQPDFGKLVQVKRDELESKWEHFEPPAISESENLIIRLGRPSKEAYESSVESYLHQYESYLEAAWQFHLIDSTIRSFPIALHNKGAIPARNIVIEIHIPYGHLFPTEEEQSWFYFDREEIPDPPDEPDPVKTSSLSALSDTLSSFSNIAALSPRILDEIGVQDGPSGPNYDELDQELSYRCEELIHNLFEEEFEPFLLSFSDVTEPTAIALEVRIHAGNLPQPIRDTLELDVKFGVGPPSGFPAP